MDTKDNTRDILISTKNLYKNYANKNSENKVLDGVNIDIYKGDFTVIMGPSGSGKSTLLHVLSGMDNLTSGKVIYKNKDISRYSEKELEKLRIEDFGFVFQHAHLVSNLTLFENVAVAGYINKQSSSKRVKDKARELLNLMNIDTAINRFPSQVSGGEAQRASIARATINNPKLIFADEPTGALNKKNTKEVLNLLTDLNNSGQSIMMVTHDLRAAIRGSRLLYLEDGKIIDEITLSKFKGEDVKIREAKVNDWLTNLNW